MADYGFAPINSGIRFGPNESAAGNMRWLAPEIISPPSGTHPIVFESKPADIFSFAMLAVEIFTGNEPFQGQGDPKAVYRILKKDRPEFPQNPEEVGLTMEMRNLLQRCWDPEPTERPTIDDVVNAWAGFIETNECI